jgi:hypothetical protein
LVDYPKEVYAVVAGFLILLLMAAVAVAAVFGVRSFPLRVARWVVLLGLALGAAGVLLVILEVHNLKENQKLYEWPTVSGVVLSSGIIGERAYRPNIVYQYVVAGITYRDSTSLNTPSFGNRNTREGEAEALSDAYPVGKDVVVHYDPAMPSRSHLRISPGWDVYGKMGLGGTLFGVAVFCLLGYMVQKKP